MKLEKQDKIQPDRYEQFLKLYSVNQKRIFVFILGLVPIRQDAEDLLQQTMMEMWKQFDHFEAESNFTAWGMTIARFRVLKYREKQQREKTFFLSDEAFQMILNDSSRMPSDSDFRLPALEGCIKKLNERERYFLSLRYEDNLTYQTIAQKVNRSVAMIYKTMTAIHTNLQRCIHRTLSVWDAQ